MKYLLSDLSALAGVPYGLVYGLLRLAVYALLGALWLVIGGLYAAAWIDMAIVLPWWLWHNAAEQWPFIAIFCGMIAAAGLLGWWCERSLNRTMARD